MRTLRHRLLSVVALVLVAWIAGSLPAWSDDGDRARAAVPRTIVVALDGTGEFTSIQDAVDASARGDTIRIKAGAYQEDVTIHSKEGLRLIGEGVDQVKVMGLNRVGAFHIGKWPYGATDVEISGLTVHEHGGLALGIFNGHGVVLRDMRINGLVFGQQVQQVRIEQCEINGSETTGVQFADSQAVLIGNLIRNNDHGVTVAGKSDVRLERNVILHNLYEGVIVTDSAHAALIMNTIVKNGGGVAFLGASQGEVDANIIALNRIGVLIGSESHPRLTYNAVNNSEHDYVTSGAPRAAAGHLETDTDVVADPRFVDPARNDFRLRLDSPLVGIGRYSYLGALPPLKGTP